MGDFVVVLGAESDARWREDDPPFVVSNFATSLGPVTITYRTRFGSEGYDATVPREMWIEVAGSAEADLATVISVFGGAAGQFLPTIALCANASVEDAEPKLAFDGTPGRHERAFFQNFVREEFGTLPPPRRLVTTEAIVGFVGSLIALPTREADRLRRATAQYAMALRHWFPGNETMALAHLFIGMEALAPLALEAECAEAGLGVDDLASSWGIQERRRGARRNKVQAEARRRRLFKGDNVAATKARKASDGFEHGFMDFAEVRTLATDARDRTAEYLRSAIFDLARLADSTREALDAPPYSTPLNSVLSRYHWGKLVGDTDDLAAPDQEYPGFRWSSRLKEFKKDGDSYLATPEETMTARFSDALQFVEGRFEVWGPRGAVRARAQENDEP